MFHSLPTPRAPTKSSAGRTKTPVLHRVPGYNNIRHEGHLDAQLASRLKHAATNASVYRGTRPQRRRRQPIRLQYQSPLKRTIRKSRASRYLFDLALLHAEAHGQIFVGDKYSLADEDGGAEVSRSPVSHLKDMSLQDTCRQGTSWFDDEPSPISSPLSPPAPFLCIPPRSSSSSSTSTSTTTSLPTPESPKNPLIYEPWMTAGLDNVLLMERAARIARQRRGNRSLYLQEESEDECTQYESPGSITTTTTETGLEAWCEKVLDEDARMLGTIEKEEELVTMYSRKRKGRGGGRMRGWMKKLSCLR